MSPYLNQPGSYDEFYGLREAPFSLTPDPKYAYPSKSQELALHTILHAVGRREGLIVLTGDIGCGKTTLCRRLLPLLPPRTFLSLILNPFLTADDLLRQVLEDYGLVSAEDVRRGLLARANGHDLIRTLQEFLNSLAEMDGTALIIVDEAQNLPLRTLEQVRLLSNYETDSTKLLQIILVGQRNFEPILELEELRQLKQRISRRCRMEPLSRREVSSYVEHRLSVAAATNSGGHVRFTPGALSTVARLSNGFPRIINLLCDRALEIGYSRGAPVIDNRLTVAAAKDLELPVPATVRFAGIPTVRPAVAAAAAAAVLVVALGVAFIGTGAAWPAWASGKRAAPAAAAVQTPAAQTPAAAPDTSSTLNLSAAAPPAAAAAPAADPAAAPTSILEAAPSYELTVASFETTGRANAVAQSLIGRGQPARVSASATGRWQMVIVGPYSSLAEANEAKGVLEQSGFSGIRITKTQ